MALPTNRQTFKDYCLRRLGFPVIDLELDDEQVEDRIDEALQYYATYHYDGSEHVYLRHQVTEEDITNRYVKVDSDIIGITNIFDVNANSVSNSLFGVRYQMALNDFFNISYNQMAPYWVSMRAIENISDFFSTRPRLRYNQHTDKVYIDMDWQADITSGYFIVLEGYRKINPEEYPKVWQDFWLTRYTCALLKRQIGQHLKKFNITLVGNVTYNGEQIYQDALQEIQQLEQDIVDTWSLPVTDMIG